MSEQPNFLIPAEAHTDDRRVEVKFDALPWFVAASPFDIAKLVQCEFGGDYPADNVAELCADHDPDLKRLFDYLAIVNKERIVCGFECHVDSDAAMAWLKTRDRRHPPVNPNATLHYVHTMEDMSGRVKGYVPVVIEADPAGIALCIWEGTEQLVDIHLEVHDGKVTLRAWKDGEIDGDPAVRVDMCDNPNSS